MEVIKSSDILEKQILEDARKKANRILKNAEKECKKIEEEELKFRTQRINELESEFSKINDKAVREINAKLPLELMRIKLLYIDKILNNCIDDFFNRISSEELLKIIKIDLNRIKDVFMKKKVIVYYNKLNEEQINKIISESIPEITILKILKGDFPGGIIINTEDNKISYKSIIKEYKDRLIEEFRTKICSKIFGDEFIC